MEVLTHITEQATAGRKMLAVLIDPDKAAGKKLVDTIKAAHQGGADLFFVGSSLLTSGIMEDTIAEIRKGSNLPIILFPGNSMQITSSADAILLLSLISGRNPEMLIGKHVVAAPYLKKSGLEIIPTGYMLIESGRPTAALYMSNSHPIPADKSDIALCTAMAGEMLGLKMIYMDAGSGAQYAIDTQMISRVREGIHIPLIVGGGIRSGEQAKAACDAGADMIVVGNAIEQDPGLVSLIAKAMKGS
jgi:putative glycerol-1-phosphate prenyltransferase